MESIIKVSSITPIAYGQELSINRAIETFLAECDIRASSKSAYRRWLRYFFKWVESTGRQISELTRADIICFKESLVATHSNLSVAGYMVALRRFYEWTEDANYTRTLHEVSNPQKGKMLTSKSTYGRIRFTTY